MHPLTSSEQKRAVSVASAVPIPKTARAIVQPANAAHMQTNNMKNKKSAVRLLPNSVSFFDKKARNVNTNHEILAKKGEQYESFARD